MMSLRLYHTNPYTPLNRHLSRNGSLVTTDFEASRPSFVPYEPNTPLLIDTFIKSHNGTSITVNLKATILQINTFDNHNSPCYIPNKKKSA
ncbi:hypothetical protein Hanom_Chr10g00887391 [Helianthus anomalus]